MDRNGHICLAFLLGLIALALFNASPALPDHLRLIGMVLSGLVSVGAVYAWIAGPMVVYVFWRALLALIPVSLGACVVIYLLHLGIGLSDGWGRALAAAVVVASGWIAGFITQELRRIDERDERRDDLIRALREEIEFETQRSADINWADYRKQAEDGFFSDSRYAPFVPLKRRDQTLRRVVDNIELLDDPIQISQVMKYFRLVDEIQQITDSFSTDVFVKLAVKRRKSMVMHWISQQEIVATRGAEVLSSLEKQPPNGLFKRPR